MCQVSVIQITSKVVAEDTNSASKSRCFEILLKDCALYDNSLKALLFKLKNDDSFELWVTMESIADRNSLLNFTLQSEKLLRF